jgi:hypothetical protein
MSSGCGNTGGIRLSAGTASTRSRRRRVSSTAPGRFMPLAACITSPQQLFGCACTQTNSEVRRSTSAPTVSAKCSVLRYPCRSCTSMTITRKRRNVSVETVRRFRNSAPSTSICSRRSPLGSSSRTQSSSETGTVDVEPLLTEGLHAVDERRCEPVGVAAEVAEVAADPKPAREVVLEPLVIADPRREAGHDSLEVVGNQVATVVLAPQPYEPYGARLGSHQPERRRHLTPWRPHAHTIRKPSCAHAARYRRVQ